MGWYDCPREGQIVYRFFRPAEMSSKFKKEVELGTGQSTGPMSMLLDGATMPQEASLPKLSICARVVFCHFWVRVCVCVRACECFRMCVFVLSTSLRALPQ